MYKIPLFIYMRVKGYVAKLMETKMMTRGWNNACDRGLTLTQDIVLRRLGAPIGTIRWYIPPKNSFKLPHIRRQV